ncbi:NADH dehydrogenase subunit 5 [Fodinisporobacter ferrooxydans]|uniref:Probable inorganic carbon transporter subunit DabB n=1 Tax=Fodinisporobacter ferrooxydans TaxID=2901836 RepID=A0ABY4CQ39_9BACL|nr:NADH dehydrogenase subunit 5 [Alicyclobacillaceae bacterium MYW30-H2]
MFIPLNFLLLPAAFFVSLAVCAFSALILLHPRISLSFVRIHVGLCGLPPLVALLSLVTNHGNGMFGPWRFDPLAWLTVLFVLTIGLIVQRYSVRYLLGDRHYRKYFALLTLTTGAVSVAWSSNDLRLLLACWGATLLGLTLLIGLNREWQVARTAAVLSGRLYALSWLVLLTALTWLAQVTGHWQLSLVFAKGGLAHLGSWERTGICLLLIVAVAIPAAQWPFQRWLLDSVVAPTPVSAVMHAGLVNAGGILLTRFAPLFNGGLSQVFLMVLSGISVLLGTGIILVQVDYKRQLVGSTIAQMGFMLIQCALGAYLAAIIHAVLHGLFKSALFLQAGSAIHHNQPKMGATPLSSFLWIMTGGVPGLLAGIGFWSIDNGGVYQWISALILVGSVWFAWIQLVAFGYGRIGRIAGISLLAGAAIVFGIVHDAFYGLLHETVRQGIEPPTSAVVLVLFLLLSSGAIGVWVSRRHSAPFAVLYLWLVRLGETHRDLVESHPKHLGFSLSQGGSKR